MPQHNANNNHYRQELTRIRTEAGLTIREIAKKVKKSQNILSRIERGVEKYNRSDQYMIDLVERYEACLRFKNRPYKSWTNVYDYVEGIQ